MSNTSLKWSRIFAWLKPGRFESNLLEQLNIPGVEIIEFRTFQHRTKAWRVEGYNPSRQAKRNEYRLNVNGFKAWRIEFRNRYQIPVNITCHFRNQGRYVPGYDFNETCKNVLPNQEADMVVIPGLKLAKVRLDKVEVFDGSTLLSSTKMGFAMPYNKWSFGYSFLLSCILGLAFLYFSSNNKEIPGEHITTKLVYILAFVIAFSDAFNITPIILMLLLLFTAPFFLHDPVQITVLVGLGCLYLWSVWRKRSSIKDFFIGALIP